MGAGQYVLSRRGGAMHGKRFVFSQLLFGSDGDRLYLRVDFDPGAVDILRSGEVRCTIRNGDTEQRASIRLGAPRNQIKLEPGGDAVDWAVKSVLEIAVPVK